MLKRLTKGLILPVREVWVLCYGPPMQRGVISRLPPADTNQTHRSIITLEILGCEVEPGEGLLSLCVCVCGGG